MRVLSLWLSVVLVAVLVPMTLKLVGFLTISWFWLVFSIFTFTLCWFILLLLLTVYLIKIISLDQ
jgi:hypothetical protein